MENSPMLLSSNDASPNLKNVFGATPQNINILVVGLSKSDAARLRANILLARGGHDRLCHCFLGAQRNHSKSAKPQSSKTNLEPAGPALELVHLPGSEGKKSLSDGQHADIVPMFKASLSFWFIRF